MKKNSTFKIIKTTKIFFAALFVFLMVGVGSVSGVTRTAIATGNWSSTATWNGGVPVATDVVVIPSGYTVTLDANTAALNSLTIASGGQLTTTGAFTVSATTITINGYYLNGSTGAITGTMTVGAGATYQHNINGGTGTIPIPTATWNTTSTCLITGSTTAPPAGINQTFGNFTWNSVQTGWVSITPTNSTSMSIQGNLTIANTNSNTGTLWDWAIEQDITVNGNLIITGGIYRICYGSNRTQTIKGNVSITGGTLVMNTNSGTTYNGTLNVAGNFIHTAGTIDETGTGGSAIIFNGTYNGTTGMQTYTSGGTITNTNINFTVNNGAYLQMAAQETVIGGTGSFTVASGGTLGVTSTAGITATGATGNIQTGTRTYNSGANYIYNGTSAQVTGTGLTQNTPANLTINSTNTVSLSAATSIANKLTLISGVLNTSGNVLSLTYPSNGAISGGSSTAYINGSVSVTLPINTQAGMTYFIPLGTSSSYLPLSLVDPITGATPTILVQAVSGNAGNNINAPLISVSNSEYWSVTPTNVSSVSISLAKDQAIFPYDVIAGCTSYNGTYSSLGGTSGFYEVNNSNAIDANRFFRFGGISTPKITASVIGLGGFTYAYDFGPSDEQSFVVNGTALTAADVTVSLPTDTHFEFSKTSGAGYQSTAIVLQRSGLTVANTTLYVRLKEGLAVGTYFENITLSSGGVTQTIPCEGVVMSTAPSVTASGGRTCPAGDDINLYSTSEIVTNLFWTGPNNYYSSVLNPVITPTTTAMNGTYTVAGSVLSGVNLVVNGDFEKGNTGFISTYTYKIPAGNQTIYGEGTYTIATNPILVHDLFKDCPDHTPDPGTKQMIINGNIYADVSVWLERVKVLPNTDYQFSYWLQTVASGNLSKLQLAVNGQKIEPTYQAEVTQGQFSKYMYNWSSGSSTSAILSLVNMNTQSDGNDFALDDIVFQAITQVKSTVFVGPLNAASVTISTPSTTVASGTNVTFTASATNGGITPIYVWKVNGTAIQTGSSSSFTYLPTTIDKVTCVMTSNLSCATGGPATSNEILMTVTASTNFWKGTTSTDWNVSGNWTGNKVPGTGETVEFATNTNNLNQPALKNLILDKNRIIGSLINNASGYNLIIPTSKELIVNDIVTLTPVADVSKKYDQIQIKAGSTLFNGTLIFIKPLQNTAVNATVEMYTKSFKNLAGETDPDDNSKKIYYNWQFFGIPVKAMKPTPALDGSYVRRWVESGLTKDDHWVNLTNSYDMEPFKGYELTHDGTTGKTIVFQGQLMTNDCNSLNLPITYTDATNHSLFPGQHIFANPYTAAIDIRAITFGSAAQEIVYLYNAGTYSSWYSQGGGTSADSTSFTAGQYTAVPKAAAGLFGSTIPRQIPSMGAAMIRPKVGVLISSIDYSISLNYSLVVMKNSSLQRAPQESTVSTSQISLTMIDVKGEHAADRMWLFVDSACTRNYDNGWDGPKILGSALNPQIFAIEDDDNYQVNSVADINNTDLGFQAGQDVDYTLTFTHQNIEKRYAGVYLVDLKQNKTIDVTASGTTYTFKAESTSSPEKRFKILTRPYIVNPLESEAKVRVFNLQGAVFVQNDSNLDGECMIYDISGHYIARVPFFANSITSIINGLKPGVYLAKACTATEKQSRSLILQ